MAQHYDPRKVLRQVSNTLLKQFFVKRKATIDIKWDEISETEIESIFDAWQAMNEKDRIGIEAIFQDITAMASEEGVKVLIKDGDTWGKDLRQDLDQWESRFDKAMWTYLNHRDVWDMAVQFARADQLEGTRPWVRRTNIPKRDIKIAADSGLGGKLPAQKQPEIDKQVISDLELALSAYFRNREGRGHFCRVQHLLRNKRQHYFFANLSDYTDSYDKLNPDSKQFVRETEQRAFAVILVYEKEAATLDIYAKGGKKVITELQEIFARVVLGVELDDEMESAPYQLAKLVDPKFTMPVEASDGIANARVRRVRVSVKGSSKRRITLEANPDAGPEDIHTMISDYLNKANVPVSLLNVEQATITIRFNHGGKGKVPTFSFNLSYPDGCSLKSLREEYRVLGEKYLKLWKIAVV